MKFQRWTDRELARLFRLRDEGLGWPAIAEAIPGRTVAACQQAHKTRSDVKKEGVAKAPAVRAACLPVPDPPRPPSPRVLSTSALLVDAEIRARIETRGLTAGLLGDPPAGRSALDRRLAGLPEPTAPADHREAALRRLSPVITLATEPLR